MSESNADFSAAVLHRLKCHDFPMTKGDIAQVTGLNTRDVEEAIHDLRHAGEPIISDSNGYRLAKSPEEMDHCIAALCHRENEIRGTRLDLEATRDRLRRGQSVEANGQVRLFAVEAKA